LAFLKQILQSHLLSFFISLITLLNIFYFLFVVVFIWFFILIILFPPFGVKFGFLFCLYLSAFLQSFIQKHINLCYSNPQIAIILKTFSDDFLKARTLFSSEIAQNCDILRFSLISWFHKLLKLLRNKNVVQYSCHLGRYLTIFQIFSSVSSSNITRQS
jgi:hypothetical protein